MTKKTETQRQRITRKARKDWQARNDLSTLKLSTALVMTLLDEDSRCIRERALRAALVTLGMREVAL